MIICVPISWNIVPQYTTDAIQQHIRPCISHVCTSNLIIGVFPLCLSPYILITFIAAAATWKTWVFFIIIIYLSSVSCSHHQEKATCLHRHRLDATTNIYSIEHGGWATIKDRERFHNNQFIKTISNGKRKKLIFKRCADVIFFHMHSIFPCIILFFTKIFVRGPSLFDCVTIRWENKIPVR